MLQITIPANNEVAHGVEKRKLRFINFVFCTKTDKRMVKELAVMKE
jgi:hypothetical protein